IIGWKLRDTLHADLVTDALQSALLQRPTTPGLYFHSDRGSQYSSRQFRSLLHQAGLQQSMSALGNPYHNSLIESLFARLKIEFLHGQSFRDIQHLHAKLFDFIERYYNENVFIHPSTTSHPTPSNNSSSNNK